MPGNPDPEPGCPQPAGLVAVLADELTPSAIRQALVARRVYATTGARIALTFEAGGQPMGSILTGAERRQLTIGVGGTDCLASVELVRDGAVIWSVRPASDTWQGDLEDEKADEGQSSWYLLRVTQQDGHRAWSSPIWFRPPAP